jgi:MFS transporter, PPP family, 3-phenylpropionic acid transporter
MHTRLHQNLSFFYFIYYFFVGAFVPYWGLYLKSEQFSAADIGILMSLFQISRIFAPNFWGWLADHTKKRVVWIRLTALLGLIGFSGSFLGTRFFWTFLCHGGVKFVHQLYLTIVRILSVGASGHYQWALQQN